MGGGRGGGEAGSCSQEFGLHVELGEGAEWVGWHFRQSRQQSSEPRGCLVRQRGHYQVGVVGLQRRGVGKAGCWEGWVTLGVLWG